MQRDNLLELNPLDLIAINIHTKKEVYDKQIQDNTVLLKSYNQNFEDSFELYWNEYNQKEAKEELKSVRRSLSIFKASRFVVQAMGFIGEKNNYFKEFLEQFELLTHNFKLLANLFDVIDRMPKVNSADYTDFILSLSDIELPEVVKEDLGMSIELRNTDFSQNVSYTDFMTKLKA